MQVEFAFAASLTAAVAPRHAWSVPGAEAGRSAASMTVALPEGTDPTGAAGASVVMKAGTHVAYAGGTKSVFVAGPKVLAVAAVNGSAAGTPSPSAGLPEAVRGRAAFSDAAGSALALGGPKKGVMTYDARMAGREARRTGVAAKVTGS